MAKSNSLSLISAALLPEFKEQLPLIDWPEYAKNFPKVSFTSDSFSFYASVSSVYSSKIEGEDIDLNSFLNHKFFNGNYQPDYTRKIDDLFEAYTFAKDQVLKPTNLLKIHPFEDGNGRMARLLEKWFLASHLGPEAWNIPSEQYYYQNLSANYRNVHLGFDYESVDYQRSLPFLLMLPQAIQHQS